MAEADGTFAIEGIDVPAVAGGGGPARVPHEADGDVGHAPAARSPEPGAPSGARRG